MDRITSICNGQVEKQRILFESSKYHHISIYKKYSSLDKVHALMDSCDLLINKSVIMLLTTFHQEVMVINIFKHIETATDKLINCSNRRSC